LLRIPDEGALPLVAALAALQALPLAGDLPRDQWPLVEVEVLLDAPQPGLRTALADAVHGRAARLVRAGARLAGCESGLQGSDTAAETGLDALTPADVLTRRWQQRHQGAPGVGHLEAFDQLLQMAAEPAETAARRQVDTEGVDSWLQARLDRLQLGGQP
jgi:exonuclease SbcD